MAPTAGNLSARELANLCNAMHEVNASMVRWETSLVIFGLVKHAIRNDKRCHHPRAEHRRQRKIKRRRK